jgi:hypothetical protein
MSDFLKRRYVRGSEIELQGELHKATEEIKRLRAALKNLYGLMCDMENDGHVTESLYNGVMQHTKDALDDEI